MLTLGLNKLSLSIQQNLGTQTDALSRAYQQLSSGQRINNASDDAAGLAISDALQSKQQLFGVANRNIGDAISATSILSAALTAQQSIVTRMQELAEQSANGVYSTTQRSAMNTEYQALMSEYQRVAQTTSFNGVSLISTDGSQNQIAVQVGTDGSSNSQISLSTVQSGIYSGTAVAAGDLNGDGVVDSSDLALFSGEVGPSMSLDDLQRLLQGSVGTSTVTDSSGVQQSVAFGFFIADYNGSGSVNASVGVFIKNADGTYSWANQTNGVLTQNNSVSVTFGSGATATLKFNFSGTNFVTPLGSDAKAIGYVGTTIQGSGQYAGKSAIGFTGVETVMRAQDAITTLANHSSILSQQLGTVGAIQSRLAVAQSVNSSIQLEDETAASRIRDVDVAATAADLTRESILQQVSTSLLAQANQQAEIVLKLL